MFIRLRDILDLVTKNLI